jgi:hypothetical protein
MALVIASHLGVEVTVRSALATKQDNEARNMNAGKTHPGLMLLTRIMMFGCENSWHIIRVR